MRILVIENGNYEYIITLNPGWSFSAKKHVNPKQFKTIGIAHKTATNKVFPCDCIKCEQDKRDLLPIATCKGGVLYSLGIGTEYGSCAKMDVQVFINHREGMKCRSCDIGKFAGGLTVDQEYLLVPGGNIDPNGLSRKYIHTSIMLCDTIDEAIFAVECAWGAYGKSLPRDIADVYHNTPVGVVYRLEHLGGNYLLKPVRALREHPYVDPNATHSYNDGGDDSCGDTEIPF